MMIMVLRLLIESVHHIDCIPDICHFFYTGKIYKSKIVHPKKTIKTNDDNDDDDEADQRECSPILTESCCMFVHVLTPVD